MDSSLNLELSDTLHTNNELTSDQLNDLHLQAQKPELSTATERDLLHNVEGTLEQYACIRSSTPITDFARETGELPISPVVNTAFAQQINVIKACYYEGIIDFNAQEEKDSKVAFEMKMPVKSQSVLETMPMDVSTCISRSFILIPSSSNEHSDAKETSNNKKKAVSARIESQKIKSVPEVDTKITKFALILTSSEYSSIEPAAGSNHLRRGWNALLYSKFHKFWSSCAIIFQYNHCRKETSRKQNIPFSVGRGLCRTRKCVHVNMIIETQPALPTNVTVHVKVIGESTHQAESGGKTF